MRSVCRTIGGVFEEQLGPQIIAAAVIRAQAYRRGAWLLWSGDQDFLLALLLVLSVVGCGVVVKVNWLRIAMYLFLDFAHPSLFEEIHRWIVATALATALLSIGLCLSTTLTRVEVRSTKAG